jgi:hypothetical protein
VQCEYFYQSGGFTQIACSLKEARLPTPTLPACGSFEERVIGKTVRGQGRSELPSHWQRKIDHNQNTIEPEPSKVEPTMEEMVKEIREDIKKLIDVLHDIKSLM